MKDFGLKQRTWGGVEMIDYANLRAKYPNRRWCLICNQPYEYCINEDRSDPSDDLKIEDLKAIPFGKKAAQGEQA